MKMKCSYDIVNLEKPKRFNFYNQRSLFLNPLFCLAVKLFWNLPLCLFHCNGALWSPKMFTFFRFSDKLSTFFFSSSISTLLSVFEYFCLLSNPLISSYSYSLSLLPWGNVIAILMDSASVMRGSKNGLEKKIRESVAPHLVDIDGDSCHHMHNIVKKLVHPHGYYLESLFLNIYNDFKLSPDAMDLLKSTCYLPKAR